MMSELSYRTICSYSHKRGGKMRSVTLLPGQVFVRIEGGQIPITDFFPAKGLDLVPEKYGTVKDSRGNDIHYGIYNRRSYFCEDKKASLA